MPLFDRFSKRSTVDVNLKEKSSITAESDSAQAELEAPVLLKKTSPLITFIFGGKVPPIPEKREPYPFVNANIFSQLTFSWISDMIKRGYYRRVEDEDLYYLVGDLTIEEMCKKFEANMDRRILEWKKKKQSQPEERFTKYLVLRALNDTFFKTYWSAGAFRVLCDTSQVLNPLLVRELVKHVNAQQTDPTLGPGKAIGYCIGISLLLIVSSLGNCNCLHLGMLSGAQAKALLTNLCYKKSFKLSAKGNSEFPKGKVNSLVMTDLARIDMALGVIHFLWSFIIALIIAIVILLVLVGAPALVGIATCFVIIGYIFVANKYLKSLRRKTIAFVDNRVGGVREVVNAMKMIKLYCWEVPYFKIIEKYRNDEKKHLLKMNLFKASMFSLMTSTGVLATMFTFLTMYGVGKNFKSYNIFSSVALFNSLRQPLTVLPSATAYVIDGSIALDRITAFLQADEKEEYVEHHEIQESENSIEVEKATFGWDMDGEIAKQEILKDISLSIKRGEFVVITGAVGTGKSSLLSAIHGMMIKFLGSVKVYGSQSFCSAPWIQNETIRENILFGNTFDHKKYSRVIKACSLEDDFAMFTHGDFTEVGERGITLSGGQKARVSLARAVYTNSDIILLDDVLSAVDARVGKHIMDDLICGYIKDKTRVLATHQLSLIQSADRIIFLNGSGGIDVGTEDELLSRNNDFMNLMKFSSEKEGAEEELEDPQEVGDTIKKISTIISAKEDVGGDEQKKHKIIEEEFRSAKSISWEVYYNYFSLGAGRFYFIVLPIFGLSCILNGFLFAFNSVWLSFWVSDKFGFSSHVYAGLYAMFCVLAALANVSMLLLLGKLNNDAGLKLFILALQKVLRTPMSFMDTTPIGRILNRFTKDTDTLDSNIADQLSIFAMGSISVCSTFILCGIYIPYLFIAYPFIGFFYISLSNYYQTSALDIKRLEAINRSNVFSHFNETLSGMSTIKSYGSVKRFSERFEYLIDKMDMAYFPTLANQRWLAVRLDFTASGVSLLVSLLCVCGVFNLGSSSTGLLISYVMQIASIVSMLMRSKTQIENDMNSCERLYEYAYQLPQEAAPIITPGPKPTWPEQGSIEFENASLRYRDNLPLVLKNVTFNVAPGEKIGIVGRTGAGKSTIMNALFRINELATGKVQIDGIDISTLGLDQLRSKMSIIPQDPVLFKGSVRQNLDPFNSYNDVELWDSLKRSWLIEKDSELTDANETMHKFHLDQHIKDEGENFSLGERQLIALARALVRNTKILVMDEATSSVDYETDSKIQSTIANEFSQCTILCIAHRLRTILKYDRILVLDHGEVKEFDTPFNLFKQNGIFTDMCQRSNITEADF
ncbi:unnamed protein product [Wickerhamomyces anomalus]